MTANCSSNKFVEYIPLRNLSTSCIPGFGVHQIEWALIRQDTDNLLAGHYLHADETGSGVGTDMWGTYRIRQGEKWIVCRGWLWIEDIQTGPRQMTRVQSGKKCRLIN